jgi:hypothetical protein
MESFLRPLLQIKLHFTNLLGLLPHSLRAPLIIGRNLLSFNLLKPPGCVMHQQFNTQQLYVLPTLYLCVLYLSENKQRLVPLTA